MREGFITTSAAGMRFDSPPMRLYQKAKRLFWDPRSIDFSQDRITWQQMTDEERDATLRLVSQFQAGEEAVTIDLLPLMLTVAREGRLDEEMYLTTFLLEEAKHVEFFRRFLDEVVGDPGDLHRYHTPSYRRYFYEELPRSMQRLLTDPSPAAQAEAAVTYNLVAEGVLAETGYFLFYTGMQRMQRPMPGLIEGVTHIQRDEARHIGYGLFLLSRLLVEHPDVWQVIQDRLNVLMPIAIQIVNEGLELYPEGLPFQIQPQEIFDYAMKQLQVRAERLRQARHKTLAEIYRWSPEDLEQEVA